MFAFSRFGNARDIVEPASNGVESAVTLYQAVHRQIPNLFPHITIIFTSIKRSPTPLSESQRPVCFVFFQVEFNPYFSAEIDVRSYFERVHLEVNYGIKWRFLPFFISPLFFGTSIKQSPFHVADRLIQV